MSRVTRCEQGVLAAILLAGFALRLVMLDRFPVHQDEAIYGVWALHGMHVDPLFLTVWPDKPPLYLWLLGWTFEAFGATPAAARLLNIAFSTLSIAIVAALACRWWGGRAAVFAALLVALSPFAISFAPTAFTDPLMVMAGLLAVFAATHRRCGWAGFWLGVAIMTKQQGVLFAPLVLAFAVRPPFDARTAARATLLILGGLLLVVAPVMVWDSLRWAVAPSPWDLGARNAAGFGFSAPDTWPIRLYEWVGLSAYLLGVWTWLLIALVVVGARILVRQRQSHATAWRPAAILTGWIAAFLALHVLTAVQVWDRYLLPLAPAAALLGAYVLDWGVARFVPAPVHPPHSQASSMPAPAQAVGGVAAWRTVHPQAAPVLVRLLYANGAGAAPMSASSGSMFGAPAPKVRDPARPVSFLRSAPVLLVALLLLAVMTVPAARAAYGEYPIGGDHGAYAGIDEAVAWVRTQTDVAPVIYHRTLGWHLRFYLFDLVQGGQVELRWYPSAAYLADNAAKTPHRPRFLVSADWSPDRDLELHLASRDMAVRSRLHVGNITVLEVTELPAAPASWRVCRLPAASPFAPLRGDGLGVQPQACMQERQP